MLELPISVFRKPLGVSDNVRARFERPIVFYLAQKRDPRKDLVCLVILDFERNEILYVDTYSEENRRALEEHPYQPRFEGHFSPHSIINVRDGKELLLFFELCGAFYRIDIPKLKVQVLTEQDIPGLNHLENVTGLGTTLYEDEEAPGSFYFPALSEEADENVCRIYRIALDLSSPVEVGSIRGKGVLMPHATRRLGKLLLNSGFDWTQFKNLTSGKVTETADTETLWEIFSPIYDEYCSVAGIEYSKERFLKLLETAKHPPKTREELASANLYPKFQRHFVATHGNFEEVCSASGHFLVPQGRFNTVNIDNGEVKTYFTHTANCAHFEIDRARREVFVSNHNFIRTPETIFFGPGSIEKYASDGEKLHYENAFSHPTSLRMTSHRLFTAGGKRLVATIGHPNRLFVIDAESMQPVHYEDIGRPILADAPSALKYLNDNIVASNADAIIPLEAGEDGMLLLIGREKLHFYDYLKREVVESIEFLPTPDFSLYSVHCQYL